MIKRRHLAIGAAAMLAAGGARRARAQSAPALRDADRDLVVAVPSLPQFRALRQRLQAFTFRTRLRARIVFIAPDQIRERVASGMVLADEPGFDVVYVAENTIPELAEKLVPLDDFIARDDIDFGRYPRVYQDAARPDGWIRGMPIRGFTQLLFYRRDLFTREGVAAPTTWEQTLTAARVIQREHGIGGVAMYYGRSPNFAGVSLWLNFLWGRGGDLFDPQWWPRFGDAAGQQATQLYLDVMLRFELAVTGAMKFRESDAINAFAQGRAAVFPGWGQHIAGFTPPRGRLKPEQIGIAAMPGFQGRAPAPCATAGMLCIPTNAVDPDAAWEFVRWASSADLEATIVADRADAEQFEEIMVHASSLAAASLNRVSNGYHAATAGSLEHARLLPRLQQWPLVAEVLDGMLAEAAIGERLLRTTLEDGARQVEDVLRRAGVIRG